MKNMGVGSGGGAGGGTSMPGGMSAGATKLISRGYGWTHAGRRAPALADIDLVVEPGEKVLLCGDSGSGKSTLLAAIAGVLGGDDEGTRVGEMVLVGDDVVRW